MKKALAALVVVFLASACEPEPEFRTDDIEHKFSGAITFEAGAVGALQLTNTFDAPITLDGGAAEVKFDYQWSYWTDDREPSTFDQASITLNVGANAFLFALASRIDSGWFGEPQFIDTTESGQTLPIQFSTRVNVVDVWVTQDYNTCTVTGCISSPENHCQGRELVVTVHTRKRRDLTLLVGQQGSTRTAFVPAATFEGSETFTETDRDYGTCY